jgi:hypothetical protein
MSVEYDLAPARPPLVGLSVTSQRVPPVNRAEAAAARRHAAEIGDYATAERWLQLERTLATQTKAADRPQR